MKHPHLQGILAGLAVAAGACALIPGPATASTATGNPWTYQMTSTTADGLVIRGTSGTNNPLIVFDRLGQPIAAVGEAGGLKVFGDNIGVNTGSDIFHSQVTISPNNPDPAVCVRNGQLWVGGPAGDIWRCANLGGGYAWWPALS